MLNFKYRSSNHELMDDLNNYPSDEIIQTYDEINNINKYLLGDYFVIKNIMQLIQLHKFNSATILDFGCGNGDLLLKIRKRNQSGTTALTLVGFDPYIPIRMQKEISGQGIYIYTNWDELLTKHKIDYAITSLTLHHLYNSELQIALQRLINTPKFGFVISDLIRSKIAYFLIKIITKLFSKSRLVKHDAPLSVAKSFSRVDMEKILDLAKAVSSANLKSTISFRWILTGIK